jgi:hypothetical protein
MPQIHCCRENYGTSFAEFLSGMTLHIFRNIECAQNFRGLSMKSAFYALFGIFFSTLSLASEGPEDYCYRPVLSVSRVHFAILTNRPRVAETPQRERFHLISHLPRNQQESIHRLEAYVQSTSHADLVLQLRQASQIQKTDPLADISAAIPHWPELLSDESLQKLYSTGFVKTTERYLNHRHLPMKKDYLISPHSFENLWGTSPVSAQAYSAMQKARQERLSQKGIHTSGTNQDAKQATKPKPIFRKLSLDWDGENLRAFNRLFLENPELTILQAQQRFPALAIWLKEFEAIVEMRTKLNWMHFFHPSVRRKIIAGTGLRKLVMSNEELDQLMRAPQIKIEDVISPRS